MVLLDGGRVAAEGTHVQLLESSGRYREILASEAARDEQASHMRLTADPGRAVETDRDVATDRGAATGDGTGADR